MNEFPQLKSHLDSTISTALNKMEKISNKPTDEQLDNMHQILSKEGTEIIKTLEKILDKIESNFDEHGL